MINRLTTLFVILCMGISVQAQDKKPPISKEEFRQRQECYLTEKAGLSKEEAAKFFPIYFELQDKRREINDKGWKQLHRGKNAQTTEVEYEEIIENVIKARIEADKLDLQYLQKFRKILPASKIYKLQRAEMKFHRDILKITNQPKK